MKNDNGSALDLVGKKFGRRKVLSREANGAGGRTRWSVSCSCGRVDEVAGSALTAGKADKCRDCGNISAGKKLTGEGNYQWRGGYRTEGSEAWATNKLSKGVHSSNKKGWRGPSMNVPRVLKLWKDARGHCQICGRKRLLGLDHDHKTGNVRGFLCQSCNLGLGLLGDTLTSTKKAIRYLA